MDTQSTNKLLAMLGSRIKQLRINQRLSQAVLAEHCGLQKANLSRIESGKTNITMLTLLSIAEGLHVTVAELFQDLQEEVPSQQVEAKEAVEVE
ncbi:MAG TPA: helix-turn-helix transcriptional regulator [Chitinophagaceae bacterium]|nr:helix-turn-helix transcriptional regulator [Chitinophagaceae bacterium]